MRRWQVVTRTGQPLSTPKADREFAFRVALRLRREDNGGTTWSGALVHDRQTNRYYNPESGKRAVLDNREE